MTSLIKPFKQNQELATFSKMLSKSDSVINLEKLSAIKVFNHYRAYKNFPKTVYYDNFFKQNMRIDSCLLVESADSISFVGQNNQWLWTKAKKFLKCADQTLLAVDVITNIQTGEKINLFGYSFPETLE